MSVRDYNKIFKVAPTAEEKRVRAINEQKTLICQKFFKAHPNLTDSQQISVYAARFKAVTPDAFMEALKKLKL